MKNKYQIILLTLIVSIFTACGPSNTDGNTVGTNLIDEGTTQLGDVNASTSLSYVKNFGIDVNATSAFAYKIIKIKYNTKDEQDNDVIASGVLVYPNITQEFLNYYKNTTGKDFSISLIVENHGTIFTNSEAPSNEITIPTKSTQITSVLMTAKAGFAVAMPDYLGYGDSNDKSHPYILKKSSARVSIDMLRASSRYMIDNNILFNGQVYISGYSEGGYVAMAMAEELEKNYADDFKVKGVAPMAGPYDVKALGNIEINATHTMQYPAFLGYLASSYSINYDDINLNTILNTDINRTTYNMLFNGSYSNVQIHGALAMVTDTNASTPLGKGFKEYNASKLFDTTFISDYQANLNDPLKNKFEENSVYNWAPKSKINLIHCVDDEIIPISMSITAYDKFKENLGSDKTLTKTFIPTSYITHDGLFIHGDCAATAYGAAVTWFNDIRSGDIK